MNKVPKWIGVIVLLITIASCSKYQKALKSSDMSFKYEMAMKFYNDADYFKAQSLFEELIGLYRGLGKAEQIYYYYAYSNYYMEDFLMASYYFKNFVKTYPTSQHAEECMYMGAYCYYLNSPASSLDQTNTKKAINEMQLFINRYPTSERVEECNNLMDVLRAKLEEKSYNNSKLYFHLREYKAAIVSFNNLLKDFPDTKYREDAFFYILKSNYSLAVNSIQSKKKERFENTILAFNDYEEYHPPLTDLGEAGKGDGTKKEFAKEAESILKSSKKELENMNNEIN